MDKVVYFIVMLLGITVPVEAEIFKFVDEMGVVYYTDVPLRRVKAISKDEGHGFKNGLASKGHVSSRQTSVKYNRPSPAKTMPVKTSTVTVKKVPEPQPSIESPNIILKDNYKDYETIVESLSTQHSLDPMLVKAIIKAESNWNNTALSPKGAMGLMQLMPGTASLLSVNNPYDPVENISGGMRYLRYLLNRFNGDLTLAIAAYNAGPEAVQRYGAVPPYAETKIYVNRVLNHYNGGIVGANYAGGAYKFTGNGVVTAITNQIQRVAMSNGTVLYTNTSLGRF
ncbi:MAG: lytic transglycosylase domain-containing protein [Nitrospirae bacterium]|nr:lytic transglycosylase domain-containing protein [Nitrospirota bacterium]